MSQTKKRLYELAKELHITTKDIMLIVDDLGIQVKSHMSMIDEDTITRIQAVVLKKEKTKAPVVKESAHDKQPALKGHKTITAAETAAVQPAVTPASIHEEAVPAAAVTAVIHEQPHIEPEAEGRELLPLGNAVTVKQLAEKLVVKPNALIQKLMSMGIFAAINQNLETEVLRKICRDYGKEPVFESARKEAKKIPVVFKDESDIELALVDTTPDIADDLRRRAPVVTVMGHVDHGKTSLLDYIRKTKVTQREAGGITQHIGASKIETPGGAIIFLDTPGHKAFTAMRARGASVTDIIVLVVAADDGVMPQTIEAIDHAQAARVPIIVAVNKIDVPGADIERVKRQLAEKGLLPESWGGETIFAPVSALTGEGIDALLEMILLQAEMLELKYNPKRAATGVVVESLLEKERGPTVTVLIKNGTLRIGDMVLCNKYYGRVKALIDAHGRRMQEAGASDPVEILGLNGLPDPGNELYVVKDEKNVKLLIEMRTERERETLLGSVQRVTLEDLFKKDIKQCALILKADAHGSLEALAKLLGEITSEKITLKIIHKGVGEVNESDILLASASNAIIVAFHVRVESRIMDIAKKEGIEIRFYNIIYEAVDEIRAAMEGMLDPRYEEIIVGEAEVRQIFKISKIGNIAGCMVAKGTIARNSPVQVVRDNSVIFSGAIASLKRFQEETKEVRQGQDCGIRIDHFTDFKEGDIIKAVKKEKILMKL